MRALFVDQYGHLGGAQHCLLDLLPALAGDGWQALVVAPQCGPLSRLAAAAGAEVAPLPAGVYSSGRKPVAEWPRFAKDSLAVSSAIDRATTQFRPDLIYVNGPRVLPAAALVARRRARPLLYHCHHRLTQPAAIRAVRAALRFGRAHLVTCCRFAVEPLFGAVPDERVQVVFNGVRGPSSPPATRAAGKFRAGVIGRIAPEKGELEFVRAVRVLHRSDASGEFVVCGEPLFDDPRAEQYARQVQSEAEGLPIEFLGWCDDIYDVIQNLDLVVVPSPREPAATRVILEAFACGVPVVAFASGGIPEVVRNGETGVLAAPFTAEALAGQMLELMRNRDRGVELGKNGRAEWERSFTLDRYQHDIARLMYEAVERADTLVGPHAPDCDSR